MWMWQETLLQKLVKFGNICCTLVTMATAAILKMLQPSKAAAHYGGYSYKVWWSLMKGIENKLNPLFCFHGNCGKVCPTDSDCFGLSRSTRCGCCSYQISSISVRRVTCYDHFCVFQFFSILAVPWQRQPFWKKQPLKAQLHMAYDIPTRFHQVWSRHLREIERTKMCGRIMIIIRRRITIIVKKKRRIAIHHPTAVGVM